MKSKGHTLWLIPTGKAYKKFSNLMNPSPLQAAGYPASGTSSYRTIHPRSRAARYSGSIIKKLAEEYNAPVFVPHVTLLGDFMQSEEECIRLTKQLVSNQKPFAVNMGEIGYEDFYFRTFFVRADKTETLLALHNRAKEIFKVDIPPYMPHLSLLYGTFPQETKEKIINEFVAEAIKEIGRNQTVEFEISSVHLVKGGKVKDWRIVGEFPFKFSEFSDPGSE